LWRAFAKAQADGLATDIGVSNFDIDLLDAVSAEVGVTPAVNQVEWSPYLFDAGTLDGHRRRGVVLEGYSALRGGTLSDPVVTAVAERLGRTPAQVIIRWHLQHGVVVIPKSREADRVRSNADVAGFELSVEDMAALDALGRHR
jgi:diketogulonate reductase-like aldo/keto reductase